MTQTTLSLERRQGRLVGYLQLVGKRNVTMKRLARNYVLALIEGMPAEA